MTPVPIQFDGLAALELCPQKANPKSPLIILLHGFGCDKETHLPEAEDLIKRGFRVLLPDAHLHGDGALPELEAVGPFQKVKQLDQIYQRTAESIDQCIDFIQRREGVPIQVGLIGISMGACAALYHITHNRHQAVKAAAAMLASPYLENHLRAMASALPEFGEFVGIDLLERIRQMDPAQKLKNTRDFPLQFQCGLADELVPIVDVRRAVDYLLNANQFPTTVRLVEYASVGHQTTPRMFIHAADWLSAHLSDQVYS